MLLTLPEITYYLLCDRNIYLFYFFSKHQDKDNENITQTLALQVDRE